MLGARGGGGTVVGTALNRRVGGSKCKHWNAEQLKRAINRAVEQEREQARETERESFAYGIKIAPDSQGLVLPWRIFTPKAQSGAIGKSTSLSHLNSVKPCPAQIENIDLCMFARKHTHTHARTVKCIQQMQTHPLQQKVKQHECGWENNIKFYIKRNVKRQQTRSRHGASLNYSAPDSEE